jgi:hypothetical protein
MKRIAVFIMALLAGCATHKEVSRDDAEPASQPLADGVSFDVAIEGRYCRPAESSENRAVTIDEAWGFGDLSSAPKLDHARVSRTESSIKIELISSVGAVVAMKAFPVVEVRESPIIAVRHEEKKKSASEAGLFYYTEDEDFSVTADGGLLVRHRESGVRDSLLVVVTPWKYYSYVVFKKKTPNSSEPTRGSLQR